MARPQIELDESLVKKLAMAQLTTPEIAQICDCSDDTIERRFAGRLKRWKDEGVGSVRRRLYSTAMEDVPITNKEGEVIAHQPKPGATAAMIFFLKNYGGMRDNVNVSGQLTVNHEDGATLDSMLGSVEDEKNESVQ